MRRNDPDMAASFLRIPPFPRHRAGPLATRNSAWAGSASDTAAAQELSAHLRKWRVGGSYWGPLHRFTQDHTVVLCASAPARIPELLAAAESAGVLDRAILRCATGTASNKSGLPGLAQDTDPWTLCENAAMVISDSDDEAALVAALCGCPLKLVGNGKFSAVGNEVGLNEAIAAELIVRWHYENPFDGEQMQVCDAITLLGKWRRQIETNRPFAAIFGVARWKQVTTDAMLWDGAGPVRYAKRGSLVGQMPEPGSRALAWIARSDADGLARLLAAGVTISELEDGMIRSNGLGANCVPPLSIVVDAGGPHFDPAQPSDLENILQSAEIDQEMCTRASILRNQLVTFGIGKYGFDAPSPATAPLVQARRTVLVTGQVEDDRSVLLGGGGLDNYQLLRRARELEPDAWIVFKPHPDVEAGHRKGHVPDVLAGQLADEIDRTSSIAALLSRVDAVHVLTSLAGFEALLRGCEVVTHGVPFYAGWGLTRDLGLVPERRTRRRSLDELIAATLILYPRYIDPVTRLPCEAELLVERIIADEARVHSPLIALREIHGRVKRLLNWKEWR